MNYRNAADRVIDRAHNAIACAEMEWEHSFTDAQQRIAGEKLLQAQRFLARAVAAKREWYATERGDYEEFPMVPETDCAEGAKQQELTL